MVVENDPRPPLGFHRWLFDHSTGIFDPSVCDLQIGIILKNPDFHLTTQHRVVHLALIEAP